MKFLVLRYLICKILTFLNCYNKYRTYKDKKHILYFWLLAGLMVFALLLNVSLGSVAIPLEDVLRSISGQEATKETWPQVSFENLDMLTGSVETNSVALRGRVERLDQTALAHKICSRDQIH